MTDTAACACSSWLYSLGLLAALVAATWAHIVFWRRTLSTPTVYDEEHRVALTDGAYCELRRLKPATPSALPPIVMVHGIATNHRNLDTRSDVSIARAARDAGRDVWLLTMRCGRANLTHAERSRVDFSSLAHHDLPQGIGIMLAKTGATQVDYLGFSMGGMLAYAALGQTVPLAQVRRVVIMGSPGFVGAVLPGTRILAWLGHYWKPALPVRFFNGLSAFVAELIITPVQHIFVNPANSLPGLMHTFMIDGGADMLGTPKSLHAAFNAWGGPKHFLLLAKENGHAADYGHMDMITGPQAAKDVFAPVIAFLAETP